MSGVEPNHPGILIHLHDKGHDIDDDDDDADDSVDADDADAQSSIKCGVSSQRNLCHFFGS